MTSILVPFGILWLFLGGAYGKSMLVIRFVNVFCKLYPTNNTIKGLLIKGLLIKTCEQTA